jgi:signal transduction histidine kinase
VLSLAPQPHADDRPGWRWRIENTVGEAGVPEADKVFDKYYRSAKAQRQSGSGLGLGLFLVKSLLELMHGTVSYTPLFERVRFEVWLPMQGEPVQATDETVSSS